MRRNEISYINTLFFKIDISSPGVGRQHGGACVWLSYDVWTSYNIDQCDRE